MGSEIHIIENKNVVVGFENSDSFVLGQRIAKMLSASTIVPKIYQGEKGLSNCLIALNMANRMGADPLMVMQNLYIVHEKPSWSSQFLIATFNSCGKFGSIRYEFVGDQANDSWGCYALATDKASGKELKGSTVTIAMAKKENWYSQSGSKWQSMPQQMLMYRSAAFLVRAYAPEIGMGLHTEDELRDAYGDSGNDKPRPQELSDINSKLGLKGEE